MEEETPILSHVLSTLDPATFPPLPPEQAHALSTRYPYINNPEIISTLSQSVPPILIQTHSLLASLGPRSDPETVSSARARLIQAEEAGGSEDTGIYNAVVRLDEKYDGFERQMREEEDILLGVYEDAVRVSAGDVGKVLNVLKEAEKNGGVECVDLSGLMLKMIPVSFGTLNGLRIMNLSHNNLEDLPDSIGGLGELEELNLSHNKFEILPDSIGLLKNLKKLNISSNLLMCLPESITLLSTLIDLDAGFNNLASLPSGIGYGLTNLEKLSLRLNLIHHLPPSICEMKSLKTLDLNFNQLQELPLSIGYLQNLKSLNLGCNFHDLTELPESITDLINLKELDLSNNQIRVLPDSFARLRNLSTLNLNGNPLVVPPMDVASKGPESVREFMENRWLEIIAEEHERSLLESDPYPDQSSHGFLSWGSSLLNNLVLELSESVSGYFRGDDSSDPYLDEPR